MEMKTQYDLVIIGAGPIGMACGIAAQKAGLNCLILEKGTLTNSLFNYPLFMTFFSTAERLEIGGIPFSCLAPKPGRQEALEYYRNIQRYFKLDIKFFEMVQGIEKSAENTFTVISDKGTYPSKKIIIATGFYDIPILINVPGEQLPNVSHYFREAHEYAFRKIIVVGANNSSVDAALECWRKGAAVTMIIRKNEINERVKYWVKPDIENRIAEGSIQAYFETSITEIRMGEVDILTAQGPITLETDFVLALTGYRPDFSLLQSAGIEISEDQCMIPKYNAETMETNVSGIYLAGVVCGGMETHKWFIENSRIHADMIITDITKNHNP
jgi:thioredoxin reductase (NADPH)